MTKLSTPSFLAADAASVRPTGMQKYAGAMFAVAVCATTAIAETVLPEPVATQIPSPGTIFSVWGSNQDADAARNFRSFENFSLTEDSTIRSFEVLGFIDQGLLEDGVQNQAINTLSGFQVTFYQEDASTSLPGTVIADQFIPSSQITQAAFAGNEIERFYADISPVAIDANSAYWFSVAAVLPNPNAPVFVWAGTSDTPLPNGDNISAFDTATGTGPDGFRDVDLAFALSASPVPGPGSVALLAVGAPLLARRRR